MDYKDKYLKYRQKYITLKALKNQIGGERCKICNGDHLTENCPQAAAASAAPVAASSDSDEWTTVVSKPRNPPKPKREVRNISLDELKQILNSKLAPYSKYVVAGFVYGSRARIQNRPDSDADIIIFWKSIPDVDFLKQLRAEIEEALGVETDFVSCWYTRDYNDHVDQRDEAYFGNVVGDAVQFIGEQISISALIERSQKLLKLKR